MDKGTRKEQNKDELVDTKWSIPENVRVTLDAKRLAEFNELVKRIESEHNEQVGEIDRISKSILGRIFTDKTHDELFKRIMNLYYNDLRNNIVVLYGIAFINERLSTIESTLQQVGEKVKLEMPNLKAQVESLQSAVKEPVFAEIHSFIEMYKQSKDKAKKAQEQYVQ